MNLSWKQAEKRIAELIRLDRYLNPKEKEFYPQWLKKQEERRAELVEEQRNREILSSAPSEQESAQAVENEPQQEAQYTYHLGDKVYIGADEYEILSFDDDYVMLSDAQFPLFNKEMTRDEFDRKIRENPVNEHLNTKEYVLNTGSIINNSPLAVDEFSNKSLPENMPTITCEWSESPVFEDGKIYSVAEFDSLMKQADEERTAGQASAIEAYGSEENWYNSDVQDEYTQFLGYDKVKFTVNMPDGTTYTERQDIGDGDGGVIDFLKQYPKYSEIIPILENAVAAAQDTPIAKYRDAFFINHDNESVAWIYYNPDSVAGGQYVTNTLSFDEIREAA